jgi:hypothetical protein
VKRWGVNYTRDGEVLWIKLGLESFASCPSTPLTRSVPTDLFYCTATDELSALAQFMQAWRQTYG